MPDRVVWFKVKAQYTYDYKVLATSSQKRFTAAATNNINGITVVAEGGKVGLVRLDGTYQEVLTLPEGESVEHVSWDGIGSRFVIKTTTALIVERLSGGQVIQDASIPMKAPLYSVDWDASGQYLALNTYDQTFIYEVSAASIFEIFKNHDSTMTRTQWLEQDGLLLTVSKVKGKDGKPQWAIEGWNPQNGENLPALAATMPSTSDKEQPPYIVSIGGKALGGDLKFGILRTDGLYREVIMGPKSQAPTSSSIVLNATPPPAKAKKRN